MRMRCGPPIWGVLLVCALFSVGCQSDSAKGEATCESTTDCAPGKECVDGACKLSEDGLDLGDESGEVDEDLFVDSDEGDLPHDRDTSPEGFQLAGQVGLSNHSASPRFTLQGTVSPLGGIAENKRFTLSYGHLEAP